MNNDLLRKMCLVVSNAGLCAISVYSSCDDKVKTKYSQLNPTNEFSLQDFFGFFKRFSIFITIEGRKEITIDENEETIEFR